MNVIIKNNYEEMSKTAAVLLAAEILEHPKTVLGLATGSTPVGMYRELVAMYEAGVLDFSQVTTFNLDEYEGLGEECMQSYHYFMDAHLFSHVNIKKENVHLPDGIAFAEGEVAAAYEKLIGQTGQIQLQVLGLGDNGHIGFNEPADTFSKMTGEITLADSTIEANKRFFDNKEAVPRKAISMGIGTIMRAKKILLLVNGEKKAHILKEVIEGPVTPRVPGSILQFHPQVTVVCDAHAAKYL